ncbi:MAG TPA: hypothetical protein VNZ64_14890 [Candidatus Acidoferrum sp.]|jgi:hypothetical protein|nr:hypothetical protein [Candidatus Acidoferrum sp.]
MNLKTIIGGSGTGFNGVASKLVSWRGQSPGAARRKEPSRRRGAARAWWLSALLALCLAGAPRETPAQTNAARATPLANRYLFIIEISKPMKSRGDGALNAIQELLKSGMHGQLQSGDTLGLWTFNSDLYTGVLPLQVWSPEAQGGINGRMLNFLLSQKCEKQPRLDKVMPTLQQVVKHSKYITIVLVSSGQTELRGTPFDEPINQLYKTWRSEQEKANMPFLTVLRAQNGSIAEYRVNQAPWAAELPPLPQELQLARVRPKPAAVAVAKAAPPMLPPLIVSGRKPPTTPPLPLAPPPTAAKPLTGTGYVLTNPTSESALASTPPPPAPASTPNAPAPTAAAAATTDSAAERAVALPLANKNNDPQPKLERQAPATTPAQAQTGEAPVSSGQSRESATVLAAKTPPLPVVDAKPAGTPALPAATSQPAASASSAPAPATVAAGQTFFSSKLVWLAALCGVGVVAGLVWFWRSRSRLDEPASLITHSLEQHKQ